MKTKYLFYLNELSVDGKRTFSFPLLDASGKLYSSDKLKEAK